MVPRMQVGNCGLGVLNMTNKEKTLIDLCAFKPIY